MLTLQHFLILSSLLFIIGLYGVLTRRNAIGILMAIELMLNAANINFIAFARFLQPSKPLGQVFAIFVMTIAAAEAAVGLAIIILVYRNREHINLDDINLLKW